MLRTNALTAVFLVTAVLLAICDPSSVAATSAAHIA